MSASTLTENDAQATNHRQVFETRYRTLPEDIRVRSASTVADPDLSALCFDPFPPVIQGVLMNPLANLTHARLIAAHHGNPVGLQSMAARVSFLKDRDVQRLLLRNNQTPDSVVRGLFDSRPLVDLFRFGQSHELTDRHRTHASLMLKRRFTSATPEERVELIVMTDGRVLTLLSAVAIDERTAALVCSRGALSAVLIENLSRWPGTPRKLIAHMLKQSLVAQSPALKQSLRRHPNCPHTR